MAKPNGTPINSGERPTDLPILRHVALYGLTFTYPVQRLFFPEDKFENRENALERAGDALHGLACAGLLTTTYQKEPLRFNKDYKYYILTKEGANRVGAKPGVTKPPKDTSTSLAILWMCTMEKKRFYRVEHDELQSILGDRAPHHNVYHVLSEDKFGPVVYRVYASDSEPSDVLKHAAKNCLEPALNNSTLRPLVDVGDYGFAILLPDERRRSATQKLFAKAKEDGPSLSRIARFTIRLGPTPQTLAEAIRGLKS